MEMLCDRKKRRAAINMIRAQNWYTIEHWKSLKKPRMLDQALKLPESGQSRGWRKFRIDTRRECITKHTTDSPHEEMNFVKEVVNPWVIWSSPRRAAIDHFLGLNEVSPKPGSSQQHSPEFMTRECVFSMRGVPFWTEKLTETFQISSPFPIPTFALPETHSCIPIKTHFPTFPLPIQPVRSRPSLEHGTS